jgi:riboflavin transporter FmnP
MGAGPGGERLNTTSLAGVAVFGALSAVLTYFSQALGLNFPLLTYLQFDFGEVAIILALFIFGPLPAAISTFVEFVTLEAIGQNAPWGPLLKLLSMVSSVAGVWLGVALAARIRRTSFRNVFELGTAFGAAARATFMTLPNYLYLVLVFAEPNGSALMVVLAYTAVFNVLQLSLVMAVSYTVLKVPHVSGLKVGGRSLWVMAVTEAPARDGGLTSGVGG